MLGPREIDSLEGVRCYSVAADSNRPGSVRRIAERLASQAFEIAGLHGIDAGDALALATRFDCAWAYRAGHALLWRPPFRAHEVHDRYLAAPLLRPFERRGLLEVVGERNRAPLALVLAALSSDRAQVRELRFLRTTLRRLPIQTLLFVAGAGPAFERVGVADLGFRPVRQNDACSIYARI